MAVVSARSAFGALLLIAPLALGGCCSAARRVPPPCAGRIALGSVPDGARITEVTTPAEVPLALRTAAIEARCEAPGHVETVALLRPVRDFAAKVHHPQPIDTGAVQNAVAVRTGSTRRYLDTTIHLPPARFASAADRDTWFEGRAAAMRAAAAPWIARAERAPNATIDTADTLRAVLAGDLAALDRLRAGRRVFGTARWVIRRAPIGLGDTAREAAEHAISVGRGRGLHVHGSFVLKT